MESIKDHAHVVLSVRIFLQNLYDILQFVVPPIVKGTKDKKPKKSMARGDVLVVKYDKSIKENSKSYNVSTRLHQI